MNRIKAYSLEFIIFSQNIDQNGLKTPFRVRLFHSKATFSDLVSSVLAEHLLVNFFRIFRSLKRLVVVKFNILPCSAKQHKKIDKEGFRQNFWKSSWWPLSKILKIKSFKFLIKCVGIKKPKAPFRAEKILSEVNLLNMNNFFFH